MKKILNLLTVTTLATTAGTTTVACGNHNHAKENPSKEIVHETKWGLDAYKNKEVKIQIKDINKNLSEETLKFALWIGIFDDDSNNHQNQEKRFNDQNVKDNLIIHDFNDVKKSLEAKVNVILFELETKKNLNSKTNKNNLKDFILLKSKKTEITVTVIYLD